MTTNIIAKWSLTAVLAISPAFAQNNVEATIPFDFTVGKTKMTAGAYTVRSISSGTIQLVRDDSKASAFVFTQGVQVSKAPAGTKLVFNRYGDSYFLSQVWIAGNSLGKLLPKSKPEIEVARLAATVQQASIPANTKNTSTSTP